MGIFYQISQSPAQREYLFRLLLARHHGHINEKAAEPAEDPTSQQTQRTPCDPTKAVECFRALQSQQAPCLRGYHWVGSYISQTKTCLLRFVVYSRCFWKPCRYQFQELQCFQQLVFWQSASFLFFVDVLCQNTLDSQTASFLFLWFEVMDCQLGGRVQRGWGDTQAFHIWWYPHGTP